MHHDDSTNRAGRENRESSKSPISRRSFLAIPLAAVALAACSDDQDTALNEVLDATDSGESALDSAESQALDDFGDLTDTASAGSASTETSSVDSAQVTEPSVETTQAETSASWRMPAEDLPHARTWMCWPSSSDVWSTDLQGVQDTIVEIALAIADFEPVSMLARPAEVAAVQKLLGAAVQVVPAPVDDLWARDTLPNFVTRTIGTKIELAGGRVRFNGWGGKQIHSGDEKLAGIVTDLLKVPLLDSGIVGEGGGLEVDGAGTVAAAESSWVNPNRNPGKSRADIEKALLDLLGAERMIWIDGLAGADITDGHIDTLARFANDSTIVIDKPAYEDPTDPWVKVAKRTKEQIASARTKGGRPYKIVEIVQPASVRQNTEGFLSTYMNYYVCNGAVIAPEFGDKKADAAAKKVLADLFPNREIVQINIDALAAGGGGIHCATQQQPKSSIE